MDKLIIRTGGITAVLGSIYLLLLTGFQVLIKGDIEDYPFISQTITLMPALLLWGAVGLFALANGRRSLQIGPLVIGSGSALMTVGFALMTWFHNENGWTPMFIGMLLVPVGLLIFGLVNWRAAVLPRWNKALLLLGISSTFFIFLGVLDLFQEQGSELIFTIYLLLLTASWLVMGVDMMMDASNLNDGATEFVEPNM